MSNSEILHILKDILVKPTIDLKRGKIESKILLSLEFYNKNSWDLFFNISIEPIPFYLGLFINAVKSYNISKLEVYYGSDIENIQHFKTLSNKYELVATLFGFEEVFNIDELENSYIVITNSKLNFVVFVDFLKKEYYFYGKKEFIDTMFPISKMIYKDSFRFVVGYYENNPIYQNYLQWLWDNYIQ